MVRSLKVAAMFLFGLVLVAWLAWPHVTPRIRYYVDDAGNVHSTDNCPYGQMYAFSGEKPRWLVPCPVCMSQPHGDKKADHDGQNDH